MYQFDQEVKKAQEQVIKQAEAREQLSDGLLNLHQTLDETEINLDIENAKLDEVWGNQEALNGNIATLIMGLDTVTNKFGADFDSMKQYTKTEKFIRVFSPQKAVEMRTQRVRDSDSSSNLNDLIVQSNSIVTLLQGQEEVLTDQLSKGEKNLTYTIDARKETIGLLEDCRNKLNLLDPQIMDLEARIGEETEVAARTDLEGELHLLNSRFNELKNEEQKMLVRSQTLEKYIGMNKTNVDSLQNQRTAQQVLIDKLKTDTAQRAILFEQYEASLKTAQQQDTAHRLNEIGGKVESKAQEGMAHIGAATNNRMMDMMERHESDITKSNQITEQKARADERFMRRFKTVVAKHDSATYGNDNS